MKTESDAGSGKVRLDKWLWAARFFKTRGLSSEAIDKGHVRLNGLPVKPSREVKPGDTLAIMDSGAYFEPDSTVFSFPRPATVMIDGDSVRVV